MARVLRTSRVAPSPLPSLPGDEHERSIPLTYLDTIWLGLPPVERVLFYRVAPGAGSSSSVDDIVSRLTDSLPRVLSAYYPLAGSIRDMPGVPNRHELFYRLGDGVAFTVAECGHLDVDDLAADGPREVAKIALLVPPLPEGGAVLALQATVLHGGLALGVAVHHAACDGAASTNFLHTWARSTRRDGGRDAAPEPPVIDRTIIRDRRNLHESLSTALPPAQDEGSGCGGDVERLFATFTLSKNHLQNVKDTVASEAARRGAPPPRCTSTVAALGFGWQCYCEATGSEAEGSRSRRDRAHCILPTDHRARLDPPVPEKYLGNCVGPCFASLPTEEITAGGLFAACSAVAAGIDEAVRGEPSYWNGWLERMFEAIGGGWLLTVAGSPRFRVYDLDFGFGRPVKVDIASVAKTGAMAMAEARGGGIEVGISLPAGAMERFQRRFADATAWLSSSSQLG